MFRRSKRDAVVESAASGADLAAALATDKQFRQSLAAAAGHGLRAQRRAAALIGYVAVARRLAADAELRREFAQATANLQRVWRRVEKKRTHRVRNATLIAGSAGLVAVAALPQSRRWLTRLFGEPGTSPRQINESIEVDVPVSVAYNQWTQFEDFPLFMEGIEHVEQRDDTRLHWVATVAGKSAEWDAKIVEQHPDERISWLSEDGKETRGTVRFETRGERRTLVRLEMSYRPEGMRETFGSAAGLDTRRIRGDLQRFKELIESRGAESGAWRGDISAGQPSASKG